MRQVTTRYGASIIAALSFTLVPAVAYAQKVDRKACLAAADEGQKLRDEGKVVAAREKFILCSAKGCPNVVSKECNEWLREVDRDVPTVSFRAFDEKKKEILDVKVIVDDKKLSDSIEAKTISLDPGPHTIRYERADGTKTEEKIVLRPGEKNRIIEISFAPPPEAAPPPPPPPPPPAPPPPRSFRIPTIAWVGAGVGVAGGVTTAVFAIMANGEETDLRGKCAPACNESERSPIKTKLLIANLGMGVGIAGLAVAVITTVFANSGGNASVEARASRIRLDVDPSNRGLSMSGRF